MNKAIATFLPLTIMLLLSSCKDDPEDGPTYTVTGHLYYDCSMQPVANQPVDLFQEYNTNLAFQLVGGILANDITDSSGSFHFEFKDMNGSTEKIRIPAGAGYQDLFVNIPERKSHANLVVFLEPSTNIQMNLIVHNPYSSSDTLEITDFRNLNTKLKIPGPFASGPLYTANNYSLLLMGFGKHVTDFAYRINNGTWNLNEANIYYCDSTNITVEIN
jgi:hypothetical protein